MDGSRRKLISMALLSAFADGTAFAPLADTCFGANAVPSIQPSCSDFRQKVSKSAPACCVFQYACTISCPLVCGCPDSMDTNSYALLPSYNGAISGCTMLTVPS